MDLLDPQFKVSMPKNLLPRFIRILGATLLVYFFIIPSVFSIGTEFDNLFDWKVTEGQAETVKGVLHLNRGKIKSYGEIRSRMIIDVDQFPVMEINCNGGEFRVYLADIYQLGENEPDFIQLGNKVRKGISRFYLKDLTPWSGRRNVVLVIQTHKSTEIDYLRFLPEGETETVPWELPSISRYEIRRRSDSIIIDGQLNESSWQACSTMGRFRLYDGQLSAHSPTRAKMLWDDDYLYLAVECDDLDIFATLEQHDDALWIEDVIELLVGVPNAPKHFLEFNINPLGTVMDSFNLSPYNGAVNWDAKGWKVKVKIEGNVGDREDVDKRWVVEMAIPFLDFYVQPFLSDRVKKKEAKWQAQKNKRSNAPKYAYDFHPEPGEIWRLNLYRIDYEKQHGEYQAWSPTVIQEFHTPSRFGEVVFSDEIVKRKR